MDPIRNFIMSLAIFTTILSSFGHSLNHSSKDSVDNLLQYYASKALVKAHSGTLYKAPLSSNLTGIEASVIRIRSKSLWSKGVNFSAVSIPPRVITLPYVKRLAIVYQSLGNWSSHYYNVNGYSLVTPIVGFTVYNASDLNPNGVLRLNLNAMKDMILIQFPLDSLPADSNSTFKCVRYGDGATMIEFSDMVFPSICSTRVQGHFAIVAPSIGFKKVEPKKKERLWKCSVIGFAFVSFVVVMGGWIAIAVCRFVKMKRMREMEREASEGETFKAVWVGDCKMPSTATVMRTQPVLENEVDYHCN
ncbi:putative transmembrane protein [Thalictrum thalictroides]|uniref:Putative transmembrane protein n=1 Tax=Thalictrum thalictroides TaxID=46969 RepID=A0A7J6V7J5_THATH|nr:putative transmembrane protein [Thalictrum thalictroides]